MRIACVRIPGFTVAVERRANPQLEEQPLVVYDRSGVALSHGGWQHADQASVELQDQRSIYRSDRAIAIRVRDVLAQTASAKC